MKATQQCAFPVPAWLLLLVLPLFPGCASDSGHDTTTGSEHQPQIIDVSLGAGGAVAVEGKTVSRETFGTAVQQAVDPEWSTVVVRITADDDYPMGDLSAIQDELRARGLVNTVYKGAAGQELALILPAADRAMPQVPAEHLARLQVVAGGGVQLDGVMVEPATITRMIAGRMARDDRLVVALDMDPAADYGDFIRTFDAVKQAKATRIQLNVRG